MPEIETSTRRWPNWPTSCPHHCGRWRAWPSTTAGPGRPTAQRTFAAHRCRASGRAAARNPRRLLTEASRSTLRRAAADAALVARVERLARELRADRERPWLAGAASPEHPVAFCCAEFGVHGSLPIYSGGLGILAGDILKEASDLALPMVGVGLMYRTGYFHQRIDVTGLQHEYWLDADPDRLPCVRVTGADGQPLTVTRAGGRRGRGRAGLACRRGPRAAVPAGHRPAREQRSRPLGHLAPVRKQPRHPPGAVRRARCRRCARAAAPWASSPRSTT